MSDAAQLELERLERVWAERGVEIDAYISGDDWSRRNLHLSRIIVARPLRGQGIGTRAMEELVALADRHGLLMTLSPAVDFGGTSTERLKKFYRRFGFVSNKGRRKDFTLNDSMYRRPNASASMGARHRPEGSEGTAYIYPVGHGWYQVRWWSQDEQRYYTLTAKPSKAEAIAAARREGFKPVVVSPGLEGRKGAWSPRSKEPRDVFQDLEPIWREFTDAYLETALWSSTGSDGKPLDKTYHPWDFSQEAIAHAVKDSNDFIRSNYRDLAASGPPAWHGHDFWLSRNRYGAGFFDRNYGAVGERLQKAAKAYGELNAYVGDDGKIYFQ